MSIDKQYIYGLVDPRTDQVCYVGVTGNMTARLNAHRTNPGNAGVANLFSEVGKNNVSIRLLEEIDSEDRQTKEKEWIDRLTNSGVKLLNVAGFSSIKELQESGKVFKPSAQRRYKFETTIKAKHRWFVQDMILSNNWNESDLVDEIIQFYIDNHGGEQIQKRSLPTDTLVKEIVATEKALAKYHEQVTTILEQLRLLSSENERYRQALKSIDLQETI